MLRFVLLHVTFCFISLCFTVVLVTVLLIKCLAGTYGSNKNSEINAKNMGLVEKVKLKNIKYIVDAEWVRYTTSYQTDTPIFFSLHVIEVQRMIQCLEQLSMLFR